MNSKLSLHKVVPVVIVFGLSKLLVFFSPLILNFVLKSDSIFGKFEYSFSLSQLISSLVLMGLSSAYAFFVVKKNKGHFKPLFHLHFLIFILIISLLTFLVNDILTNIYFGSFILSVALADQVFISATLKLKDRNLLSVLIDSMVYIVLSIYVILIYFEIVDFSLKSWYLSVFLGLIFTGLFYHLREVKNINVLTRSDFKTLYSYTGLIFLSTPLLFLLTSGSRFQIEYFLDFEAVGKYSFFFRVASVGLIFHRIITIIIFREIFTLDHIKLDSYYSKIGVFVSIINLILILSILIIPDNFNYPIGGKIANNKDILILCFFQVNFWINTSLFEPVIQRENLVQNFILILLILNLVLVISLFILSYSENVSLHIIIWLNTSILFILSLLQIRLIKPLGFYKKTQRIHTGMGLIFMIYSIYFLL